MTSGSSPNGWREHAGTLALFAIVLAVLVLAYHVLHDLSARAARGEGVSEALGYQRKLIGFSAVLVLVTATTLAALLWRLARATLRQEVFPPAGLPKLLDAKPRKGVAAIYLGRRLRVAALFSGLGGLALALAAAWYALRL